MTEHLILAQAVTAVLVSWWKAILILPPFLGWAWFISTRIDKDTRYFHFNQYLWNGINLVAGAVALALMLLIPIFWISWPAGVLVLAAPILVYWQFRNARVPENKRWKLSGEGFTEKLEARRQAKASRGALLQFVDASGATRKVPVKDDPLLGVHVAAEDLLAPAMAARASRIDVVLGAGGAAVSQTIDGVRYKREAMPADAGLRVMEFLKDLAGLDVKDRRKRQTGGFRVKEAGGDRVMTVTTSGSSTAHTMRIDVDRAKSVSVPFDGLGLLPAQTEALNLLMPKHERHGIVLIGAPPGHGLTTTAYSFLARHDAYTSNIKTLEREISREIDGVDQVVWDPNVPEIDYATNLQSILRRDPDVVLTAEILDAETARVANGPGMTGPLLYIPQPLPTVSDQIRDWVKKVGDVKEAVSGLRIVTNQRLLRKLCPNCRQAYQPTADQLKKLNLPAAKVSQLFRASGKVQVKNRIEDCPVCKGTGYFGQSGVFEVFVVDEESRKLLAAGDLKGALADARRKKMIYLQEAALAKVAAGETSIEELIRVTAPTPPASPSASQPSSSAPAAASGGAV